MPKDWRAHIIRSALVKASRFKAHDCELASRMNKDTLLIHHDVDEVDACMKLVLERDANVNVVMVVEVDLQLSRTIEVSCIVLLWSFRRFNPLRVKRSDACYDLLCCGAWRIGTLVNKLKDAVNRRVIIVGDDVEDCFVIYAAKVTNQTAILPRLDIELLHIEL